MSPFLRAERLNKSFGGVAAVQNVSIHVPQGAIFALIGPNGAGKSTLLNLLSGIYQPDSGSLLFNETDLIGLRAHARVRLGIARTFQKIRLFKQQIRRPDRPRPPAGSPAPRAACPRRARRRGP